MKQRLRPADMDPSMSLLLLTLSLDTCIGESRFNKWLHANRHELETEFYAIGDEPDSSFAEHTFGIWARVKFRESVSA